MPGQSTISGSAPTAYAGGSIRALFNPQGGGKPAIGQVAATIGADGSFSLVAWDNSDALYAPSTTTFLIQIGMTSYSATTLIAGTSASITALLAGAPIPPSGGGTPSGPDTSVQFDNGGAFGGDATMQWNNTTKRLTLGPDESTILPYFQDWFGASPLIITNVSADNQAGVVVEALSTGTLTGVGIVSVGEVTDADHPGSTIGLEADAATDQGTHNIVHLTGASVSTSNNGSGTATLARGLVINTNFNRGGGAITQGIGLDIDNQDEADTNWAIRTGLGKVQFGDAVTAPSVKTTVYTVATLPSAAAVGAGAQVVVSDGGGGTDYMIALSNGSTWTFH